jgi:hypothetical protein
MEDIKLDILDYLGKFEEGIFVVISIGYLDDWYEAIFYYKDQLLALTPDEKFEEKIGVTIEDWDRYEELMFNILKRVVPYEQIINQVGDFNPESYDIYKEIQSGTQSS